MFKKLMANLGRGGAKVDLVLSKNQFTVGERVEGQIIIYGGNVEQPINYIDVSLEMDLRVKDRHFTRTVTRVPVHSSFVIQPHEQKILPFDFILPQNLPISGNYISFYFKTHLDIAGGVDHTDRDYIYIIPPLELENVLTALGQLGFREKHDSRSFNGYVQEFEMYPTGLYCDRIKEIEFVAAIQDQGIRLLLEVELFSFGHKREWKRELFVNKETLSDLSKLVSYFRQVLDEMTAHQAPFGTHSPYAPYGHHHPHPHHYGSHDYYGHSHPHKHHDFSGAAGAIGGFAAGVLGGIILDELLDDDDQRGHADDDEGFFDDFFDGDDGGDFI